MQCNNKDNIAVVESLEVLGERTQACEVTGLSDKVQFKTQTINGRSGV